MKETYADRAKTIMSKYKRRLGENFDKGDSLALEAMNQELSLLREEQEAERAKRTKKNTEVPEYNWGGLISDIAGTVLNGFQSGVKNGSIKAVGSQAGGNAFASRVPWMGAAAGMVGNLLMNKKLDLPEYKPEEYKPTAVTPRLVDYTRGREAILAERDLADNLLLEGAKGLGSQNALMENVIAAKTGTQRVAGQQINQSLENEQNTNAQILGETDRFNAQMGADAARVNLQNELYGNQISRENMMINADRRDARTQGIMDSVKGYMKDRISADQYDQMLNIMTPDNYKVVAGKDSKFRKFFGISPQMEMVLSKSDSFKEKGGELGTIKLFGDDEYERLMMRVNKPKKK